MKKTLLCMSIAAATAMGVARADDFDTIDVDVDGKISADEMTQYSGAAQNWSTVDGDGDGYISRSEFDAMTSDQSLWAQTGWNGGGGPDAAKQGPSDGVETDELVYEFDALDTDRDGKLSRTEMTMHGGVTDNWTAIDVNQDEYLDSDEFSRFEGDKDMVNATGWNGKRFKSDLQQ